MMFRRDEDDQFSQIKPMFLVRYFPKFDSHPTPSPTKFGVQIPSNTFPYTTPEEMLPSVFKHRFGFGFFRSFLAKNPMSTSFYVQELHRALREQGPAIHSFRVVNATSLQAVAHVKVLEGHSIGVVLTQQGYKIDSKPGEGPSQVFETVDDLLHSISALYVQKRSQALFEALKRIS